MHNVDQVTNRKNIGRNEKIELLRKWSHNFMTQYNDFAFTIQERQANIIDKIEIWKTALSVYYNSIVEFTGPADSKDYR